MLTETEESFCKRRRKPVRDSKRMIPIQFHRLICAWYARTLVQKRFALESPKGEVAALETQGYFQLRRLQAGRSRILRYCQGSACTGLLRFEHPWALGRAGSR